MSKKVLLPIIICLILLFAGIRYGKDKLPQSKDISKLETNDQSSGVLISEVYYQCRDGKHIKADFFKGPMITIEPGEPPNPSGSVNLVLGDGRNITLKQTISGSGARYATEDESMVFWGKGENVFITEKETETYTGCTQKIWTLGNDQIDKAVNSYLLSNEKLSWQTQAGSNRFCIFQNLNPNKTLFPHYLWVRCSEYKIEGGQLKELSGTSVPIKLDYPNELSYYDLSKFTVSIPKDGSLYDKDVKEIFPEEIWDKLHFDSSTLNEKIEQEALKYFNSD